jgi:hypothetical protein
VPRRAPIAHLGERVPDVPFVGLPQLVNGHDPRA